MDQESRQTAENSASTTRAAVSAEEPNLGPLAFNRGVAGKLDRLYAMIAKVAHETNRAYCDMLGDHSQVRWEDAPQWQKDSAIAGVKLIVANRNWTPEMSHQSWMKQKLEDGWTWGSVKDEQTKTHPCMVDYHRLSHEQRMKDHLFIAVVKTLLNN